MSMTSETHTHGNPPLAERIVRPFQEFATAESAGGIVLLACTALALGWANSRWSASYFSLWERTLTVGFEGAQLAKTLHHWINDGLMVVFFFLVGLEIKREMRVGELASLRQAMLPIAAAFGGMVVPAAIFALFNSGHEGAAGWGIPMATDIAFALGVLALLGSRIPTGLKVFLAALAIVDDIGAVLVIAIFYTVDISVGGLGAALSVLVLVFVCNRAGVRSSAVYALLGVGVWFAVLKSGVHPTVAGVFLALMIPARTRIDEDQFAASAARALKEFSAASDPAAVSVISNPRQQEAIHSLERSIDLVQSPLLKMEHGLQGIVAFAIMPLFAFANAGVRLNAAMLDAISWRVLLGVFVALVAGKFLGVTLTSLISVRLGVASLPAEVGWSQMRRVSLLAGIGFTMSLFIANLAFEGGPLLDSAKLGILAASLVAGITGWALLRQSGHSAIGNTAANEDR
jgi:Na+:H+ antiporter, NhaA family